MTISPMRRRHAEIVDLNMKTMVLYIGSVFARDEYLKHHSTSARIQASRQSDEASVSGMLIANQLLFINVRNKPYRVIHVIHMEHIGKSRVLLQ